MRVFDNLYVVGGSTPTNTTCQAIDMGDNNALQVTATVVTGTSPTLTIEGSNDLSNWVTLTATFVGLGAGPAFGVAVVTSIAWRYTRVRAVGPSSGSAILNVDVHTQKL